MKSDNFYKKASNIILILNWCVLVVALIIIFMGLALADTELTLVHEGATGYRWYVDGELKHTSTDKVFRIEGNWPYTNESKHSFTAVNIDEESVFESAPFVTGIIIPNPPKIGLVKITLGE